MPKSVAELDVLVIGAHPCASLAASLLRQGSSLRVMQCGVGTENTTDRLIVINPEFFELHAILGALKKKLELSPIYGLRFLADDPATRSEYQGESIGAYVTALKPIRAALQKVAKDVGVEVVDNDALEVKAVDEHGVEVVIDGKRLKPRLLIVAADLATDTRRVLGMPENWDADVIHRYTYLKCKSQKVLINGSVGGSADGTVDKPLLPMSLDLKGRLTWAWMLCAPGVVQFAVEQPAHGDKPMSPEQLMRHWLGVLEQHGVIRESKLLDASASTTLDLPFAGALSQEGVANRTLLIGPAGGFYTACAEDMYPACWSAIFAADAAKKALKEKHLQDALQPYRHKWGATLGDYLRGPQQNLRFLLPLVYRNKVMTARLAEAILFGKSVVR